MSSPEILIVEDKSIVAEELRMKLEDFGYSVPQTCTTAESALSAVEEISPDLVLMDIVLAGEMDGLEAADRIWSEHRTPVVYISAHTGEEYREQAKETEAFGYLNKPIDENNLQNTIEFGLRKAQMEKNLRREEARLKRVQEMIDVGSWELDLETGNLTWSEETYRIFNLPLETEVYYEDFLEFIHPEDRDYVDQEWEEALESGGYDVEHRIVVDGETKWVREKAEIEFNSNDKPVEVLGSVQDITERKAQQMELNRSQTLLETIFENVPIIIMLVDRERRVQRINKAGLEFASKTASEMVGQKGGRALRCLNHLEHSRGCGFGDECEQCPVRNAVLETFETGESCFRREGTLPFEQAGEAEELSFWVSTALIDTGSEEQVLVSIENITDQKQVEENLRAANQQLKATEQQLRAEIEEREEIEQALRKSEQQFRTITENTDEIFWLVNGDWTEFLYVNEQYEEIFGATISEVEEDPEKFLEYVHPEDRRKVESMMQQLAQGEAGELEYRVNPESDFTRWVWVIGVPIQGEEGSVRRIIGTAREITERKEMEAELRAANQQLKATEQQLRVEIEEREKIEAELRESEARLKKIIEAVGIGIFIVDKETHEIVEVNERGEEIIGLEESELCGEPCREYICPGALEECPEEKECPVIDLGQEVDHAEGVIVSASGREIPILKTAVPVTFQNEDYILESFVDITERKKIEEKLRESEHKFRELFESSRDALVLLDREGFLDCNRAALELFGIDSADEFTELMPWELSPETQPDGRRSQEVAQEHLETAYGEGEAFFEWIHQREDGEEFVAEVNLSRLELDEETVLQGLIRDVTERKETQRELQIKEQAIETSVNGAAFASMDGTIFEVNEAFLEMWNLEREETAIGRHVTEFIQDSEEAEAKMEILAEEKGWVGELTASRPDGTEFEVQVSASLVTDDEDNPICMMASFLDVTERKVVEEELRRLSRAVEQSPATVVVTDTDGAIEYANPQFSELTGYRLDEIMGENPRVLQSGYHSDSFYQDLWSTIQSGKVWRGEFKNQKKDGELYWEDASIAPVKEDSGEITHFIKVGEDITERRRARENLRRINKCFLNFTPDPRENIERLTEVFGELLEADSALYNRLDDGMLCSWGQWSTPEDFVGEDQPEGHICYDVIQAGSEEIQVINDLQETEYVETDPTVAEYDLQTYVGKAVTCRGEAVGSLCAVYQANQQVTEEEKTIVDLLAAALEVEEERLRVGEELRQSNLELKQFANVATHDLKQPLRTVTSYVELLERRYGDQLNEEAEEYIQRVVSGTENMRELLDGLLKYSKVQTDPESFEKVDIENIVREVREDLEVAFEENNAELFYEELPRVLGDRSLLSQLFQNLIKNALTYRDEAPPQIEITVRRKADDWQFAVADNGIGMKPEYTEQVFEVFERLYTDDEISGTGIGLAVCRKIVNSHGGNIWAEAEPGEGTTFFFTLPAAD